MICSRGDEPAKMHLEAKSKESRFLAISWLSMYAHTILLTKEII